MYLIAQHPAAFVIVVLVIIVVGIVFAVRRQNAQAVAADGGVGSPPIVPDSTAGLCTASRVRACGVQVASLVRPQDPRHWANVGAAEEPPTIEFALDEHLGSTASTVVAELKASGFSWSRHGDITDGELERRL